MTEEIQPEVVGIPETPDVHIEETFGEIEAPKSQEAETPNEPVVHPMPILTKWKCHKEVQAEIIEAVMKIDNNTYQIVPKQPTKLKLPIYVDNAYVSKHKPEKGGVFVKYEDGYLSYSPIKAFREGYTKL